MHHPYEHIEKLAFDRHADLAGPNETSARISTVSSRWFGVVPRRSRRHLVVAVAIASLAAGSTAYALAEAADMHPEPVEHRDSLVINERLRAI